MSDKHMKKDFLYKTAEKIYKQWIEKDKSGKWLSVQVKENIKRLYPFSGAEKVKEHYVQKIRFSLLAGITGFSLAAGLLMSEVLQPVIRENRISREGYGGDIQEIPVKVTIDDKEEHELVLKVRERLYGKEQIEKMYEDALQELENTILGENESLDHVERDLKLVTELPGYPFRIMWESQNYHYIDAEGKLQDTELSEEGVTTGLNAIFTYEDFRAEYLFYIQIYPVSLTEEESAEKKLLEIVEKTEAESREKEILQLPSELDGKHLVWSSQGNKTWLGIFFLTVCTAGVIYFLKDEDLKKEVKRREEQMRLAYPEVVSKLSIYLGAGMTSRTAWEKICADYEKRKSDTSRNNCVYEEMKTACQEMKIGISEVSAYERFGKRCGIPLYSKFSVLLIQNLRKGSTKLGLLLKEESRSAFEERKNSARKAGEEAGTKLLLPMMMMLCIVMLMILLPAFMTF